MCWRAVTALPDAGAARAEVGDRRLSTMSCNFCRSYFFPTTQGTGQAVTSPCGVLQPEQAKAVAIRAFQLDTLFPPKRNLSPFSCWHKLWLSSLHQEFADLNCSCICTWCQHWWLTSGNPSSQQVNLKRKHTQPTT